MWRSEPVLLGEVTALAPRNGGNAGILWQGQVARKRGEALVDSLYISWQCALDLDEFFARAELAIGSTELLGL